MELPKNVDWPIVKENVCKLQLRQAISCCSLFIFYFCFSPSAHRLYSCTLICARCTANPQAGSLLCASNSDFNLSQPEARHQHPSSFIHSGSCASNSACKAPVIQPWDSQHRVTYVSFCFHHLSFTLSLFPCIAVWLRCAKLTWLSSCLSFSLVPLSLWPLVTSRRGPETFEVAG